MGGVAGMPIRPQSINQNDKTMNNKCYRADYDVVKDSKTINQTDEYFWEESDEKAIESAKEYALQGMHFADVGDCKLDLVQVVEVDDKKECLPELRTIWY